MSEGESNLAPASTSLLEFDPLAPSPPLKSAPEAIPQGISDNAAPINEGIEGAVIQAVDGNTPTLPSSSTTTTSVPDGVTKAEPTCLYSTSHNPPTDATLLNVSKTTDLLSPEATQGVMPLTLDPSHDTEIALSETTPTKTIQEPVTTNTPSGRTPSSKKRKKKKHKCDSVPDQTNPGGIVTPSETHTQSQVTTAASHMTSDQITSQMNEIDSFLQALNVGTAPVPRSTTTQV